jgi:hypothetical protein
MPINLSSEFSDVLENGLVSGTITVGTSAVEVKVGANRLAGREYIELYNSSNATIYYGPSGVTTSTGIPIFKGQVKGIPAGEEVAVYLIAAGAGNTVVAMEWA